MKNSEEFRANAVKRALMPNGPTGESLADELGVGYSAISRWKREYREAAQMKKKQSRPRGFSA